MLEKLYFALWGLGLITAGTIYMTGNMTPGVATIFGFMTFGVIFLGMIGVLPIHISHGPHTKH